MSIWKVFFLNAGCGLLKIVNFSCSRSSCYRRTSKHVSQYRHDVGDNHASITKLTVETTMKATTKKSEKRKICFFLESNTTTLKISSLSSF
jgi:hypothetical protein